MKFVESSKVVAMYWLGMGILVGLTMLGAAWVRENQIFGLLFFVVMFPYGVFLTRRCCGKSAARLFANWCPPTVPTGARQLCGNRNLGVTGAPNCAALSPLQHLRDAVHRS